MKESISKYSVLTNFQPVWYGYLLEVMRETLASSEAELQLLRNSLRYRLGESLLEAFPLGPKTILVFIRLLRFYFKRSMENRAAPSNLRSRFAESDIKSRVIVFGSTVPDGFRQRGIRLTNDPEFVCHKLDLGQPCGTLVIRRPVQEILRRLTRARNAGWYVVWCPEADASEQFSAFAAYARAHVDECQEAKRT